MSPEGHHLAHFNWATLIADVDSPKVREFVHAVDRVNRLAERSDGFVWRSGDEAALAQRVCWPLFDNTRVIASFSLWQSPEALEAFVYKTVHGAFYKRKALWFEPDGGPNYVLWWVPAGMRPTITDARSRVEAIQSQGATANAFDFGWLTSRAITT